MGKAVKSIGGAALGAGVGGALLGGVGSVAGGVIGGGGGLKDALFGKKDPGTPDRTIWIDPYAKKSQQLAGSRLNEASAGLGFAAEKLRKQIKGKAIGREAQRQVAERERQIMGGVADAQRQAKQMAAQRGLGKSSIGLAMQADPARKAAEQIQQVRAAQPALADQIRGRKIGQLLQTQRGLADTYGAYGKSAIFQQGRASAGRTGGIGNALLGIGGAAIGGMMGGPAGAGMGMQMGQSVGNAFRYS